MSKNRNKNYCEVKTCTRIEARCAPRCCIYNVITCFSNAAKRAQFAVTFHWLSSLSCCIISRARVDDQLNRAAPSIEINPTLFEARNTSRYNHACQSQCRCRGHEGINRTGITRAMALNVRKNKKSCVPVVLVEVSRYHDRNRKFSNVLTVNETFAFKSQLLWWIKLNCDVNLRLSRRRDGKLLVFHFLVLFAISLFLFLFVFILFFSISYEKNKESNLILGPIFLHLVQKSNMFKYVVSSHFLQNFSLTVASFRPSLSLSAQYFALGDKNARGRIRRSSYRRIDRPR